jgi:RNA-directed DNA polymerase
LAQPKYPPRQGVSTLDPFAETLAAWLQRKVRKLQLRIARASRQKRWRLVRQLQRCLTRSHYAKLLAVKKVTGNRGRRTPGVDGEIWSTPEAKLKAALRLRSTRYRASPLRRVYIPKSNGKLRPLSIPTMYDRAMQALHAQALLPISETLAAKYSYGFRPGRSTADAIERCLKVLAGKDAATWVLEADIEGCFDNISHCWIEKHIPMQHSVLRQWLKSGVVESKRLFPTAKGVPQGGIISPIISNMVLDALEQRLEELLPKTSLRYRRAKVHIVRYADDFVVTGSSPKYLEETVTPLMVACLKQRGLKLSAAKTRITHIADGFDFLGQTVRKRQGKLLITPSRASQKAFKRKVRATLHKLRAASQWRVINTLRPLIRGWGNYHHHVVSSVVFSKMDAWLWRALWRWAVRRHPNKRKSWVKNRYFARLGTRDWMFVDKRRAGLSGSQEYKPDMDALRLSTLPYLSSIRSCLAHARRRFNDAVKARGRNRKRGQAHRGLALIRKLYRVEGQARKLTPQKRYAHRQNHARPILAEMRAWLDEALPQVPPSSAAGKALNYLHNEWNRLIRYLDDGRLEIDNNHAENAIRPFLLGRKNWLFSTSIKGVKASANLYSLIETAKANGLEPYVYLRTVFTELPKAMMLDDIEALLPWTRHT